jgi:hypothetical protein
VHVFGEDIFLESFNEFTRMLSVNAHGGSLALAARVQMGQRILVVNKSTGEENECRVVNVADVRDGKWTVGIECLETGGRPGVQAILLPGSASFKCRLRRVTLGALSFSLHKTDAASGSRALSTDQCIFESQIGPSSCC